MNQNCIEWCLENQRMLELIYIEQRKHKKIMKNREAKKRVKELKMLSHKKSD
jgi:hypothetical protein